MPVQSTNVAHYPCSFAFVGGEGAGAMAACEPGMGMNIYGECVCVPLSTNDKCRSKPPANQNAGMVCARYQPCRYVYGAILFKLVRCSRSDRKDVVTFMSADLLRLLLVGVGESPLCPIETPARDNP
jgi:hypothetical protein